MYKFVALFKYDSPSLSKVKISKETEKTITIESSTDILGSMWIGKRLHKEDHEKKVFDDPKESLDYLADRCDKAIKAKEKEINELRRDIIKMLSLLKEIEADNE